MSIRYSKYLPGLVFILDVVLLNLAFHLGQFLTTKSFHFNYNSSIFIVIANLIWIALSTLSKNYVIKRPLILQDNINKYMLTLIYHLFIVFAVVYALKINQVSPVFIFESYGLFFISVFILRSVLFAVLDYIRKYGFNNRKVIVIGDDSIAKRLISSFADHPEYGYSLVDLIPEEEITALPEMEIFRHLLSKEPNEIFVCYKQIDSEWLKKLILFADTNFIKIKLVSDLFLNNNYVHLVNYHDVPVLHITSKAEVGLKIQLLKRSFDICFSSLVMVGGLPVFFLLYIVTKTTSNGPAFYKQERIGRNGKPFNIYKFRSMYIDSEKLGPQLAFDNDPRITKWGRIIRKTRLDELPQFWNVLKGDMSVVGPRPERQHFIEKIAERTPNYKTLLYLKPGLTSMGQVHYGYAENVDQMVDRVPYDMQYLKNVSLNSDISIIAKTVKVMVQGKGK
ncbi:sugar transferase [Mucilaginibacter jinjuensis]|uniref:Sugar transferase n=1 Tax=Mucilaginibacter jinjuensis TaxID=1176721 RepID=A0ABY7TFZ8_9SPHI|nr:sugar transferase [Mucilaginibacter jinjuensis]WCT14920.1 sugar transferase [Mucilaginibacter jinjuensis]